MAMGQDDNAHAAQPLDEGSPEEDSPRQVVKAAQYGCSRSGEFRHVFKKSVDEVRKNPRKNVREGPEKTSRNSAEGDNQESVPARQARIIVLTGAKKIMKSRTGGWYR